MVPSMALPKLARIGQVLARSWKGTGRLNRHGRAARLSLRRGGAATVDVVGRGLKQDLQRKSSGSAASLISLLYRGEQRRSGQGTTSGGSVNSCKAWAKTWAPQKTKEARGGSARSKGRRAERAERRAAPLRAGAPGHRSPAPRAPLRRALPCRPSEATSPKRPQQTLSLCSPLLSLLSHWSNVNTRRPLGAGP